MLDFATRVHNHNYRLDPIIRSLLDTDFYKFLMHQFIWMLNPDVPVTFSLINRTRKVRLAELIPEASLRAQLDFARDLHFQENELIWLAGNRFYGRRDIFRPEYIEYLRGFRLPDYRLGRRGRPQRAPRAPTSSDHPSSALRTRTLPSSTAWRPSAPIRTSCRWWSPVSPATMSSSRRRNIPCWINGRRCTTASCSSCCRTPSA